MHDENRTRADAISTPPEDDGAARISLRDFFADPANHQPREAPGRSEVVCLPADGPVDEAAPDVFDAETGHVRVMSDRCATCLGRPGNRANLSPARLRELLGLRDDGTYDEGWTVCHSTLPGAPYGLDPAVCAWIAQHPKAGPRSLVMRLAAFFGIDYVDPPVPHQQRPCGTTTRAELSQG